MPRVSLQVTHYYSLVMVLQGVCETVPRTYRGVGTHEAQGQAARGCGAAVLWQAAGRRNERGNTRLTGSSPGLASFSTLSIDDPAHYLGPGGGNASIKYTTHVAVLKRSVGSR